MTENGRAPAEWEPASAGVAGETVSLWLDTTEDPGYPALTRDLTVDVAVLGAGITGVTTALLLQRGGASVALLDAGLVCQGVTGHTTAKLTSLHGLTYDGLISSVGEKAARAYGEANQAGLARVASFVEELRIDCDFARKPNYTYAEGPEDADAIADEVAAARRLGLPADHVDDVDLPFPIAGAVRFEDQAEFHPRRYVLALAERAAGEGSQVFQRTRAVSVDDGPPCRVRTEDGAVVTADQVVVATHIPFLDRGLYFARTHPERSYVLGLRVRGPVPAGMYLSTESPAHSIRAHPVGDGEPLLLVGGESHKTGQGDSVERYRRLEAYARERFDVESVPYRWSSQDNMPIDGLPYVGKLTPLSDRVHTATGFKKWGLAFGTAAAEMIADAILGEDNPWAEAFDPARSKPRASAPSLTKESANVALWFLRDRVRKRGSAVDLSPGEGDVVGTGIRQAACYRDDEGELHSVTARCTHLGCLVSWNGAERTWDCPCHGSRFGVDGEVVHGPAVSPLRRVEPPGD